MVSIKYGYSKAKIQLLIKVLLSLVIPPVTFWTDIANFRNLFVSIMPLETLLSPRFKTSLALIGPPVVGRTDPIGLIEVRVAVQTLRLNSFQLPTNQTREIKGKNLQSPSLLGVVTEASFDADFERLRHSSSRRSRHRECSPTERIPP